MRVDVPIPSMRHPIFRSMLHKSTISGSRAALRIVVTPLATTAAIRMFSVAPTLGKSKSISAPCNRDARPMMPSAVTSNVAPIASSPRRCMSMGRPPKSSPPGNAISISPHRPSNGPTKLTDARMRSASSKGATGVMAPLFTISMCWPTSPAGAGWKVMRNPTAVRRSAMMSTSTMTGAFVKRYRPSASNVAAISFKTEFLAPGTVTSPAKGPLCEATMMSPTVFDPSDMAISMLPPYP